VPLEEEEESAESQALTKPPSRAKPASTRAAQQAGTKRKASALTLFSDSDEDMADAHESPKKRAIENTNAVEPSEDAPTQPPTSKAPTSKAPPSKSALPQSAAFKTPASKPPTSKAPLSPVKASAPSSPAKNRGAEPGKPDTDAAFLKAIASTRKGKRTEDDFDRDFNKLRISRPGTAPEEPAEAEPEDQWAILHDFGDGNGLSGNFMTIVEMPVFRKEKPQPVYNPAWDGKPNFKKFKKVCLFFSTGDDESAYEHL
jgi:hypothetical protein